MLFIILLKSHFTEESGYNCSDFLDGYGLPLKECPPAKFMLTDNLVECFDEAIKNNSITSRFIYLFFFISTYRPFIKDVGNREGEGSKVGQTLPMNRCEILPTWEGWFVKKPEKIADNFYGQFLK